MLCPESRFLFFLLETKNPDCVTNLVCDHFPSSWNITETIACDESIVLSLPEIPHATQTPDLGVGGKLANKGVCGD